MIGGGRFDLWHDVDSLVRFTVIGAAGASSATLRIAESADSLPVAVDLVLSSSLGQLTLTDVGADLQVDATFTAVPATLPPGWRYFELIVIKAGRSKVVKTGAVKILASLAA